MVDVLTKSIPITQFENLKVKLTILDKPWVYERMLNDDLCAVLCIIIGLMCVIQCV